CESLTTPSLCRANGCRRSLHALPSPTKGVGWPAESGPGVTVGVLLEPARCGQFLDDVGLGELDEKVARCFRILAAGPERAGEQQSVAGAGHGDVGEPSLLVLVVGLDRIREGSKLVFEFF